MCKVCYTRYRPRPKGKAKPKPKASHTLPEPTLNTMGGSLAIDEGVSEVVLITKEEAKINEKEKATEAETSDEDEVWGVKPKLGEGLREKGAPITVINGGRPHRVHNGCGLCSPGRWTPANRNVTMWAGLARIRMKLVSEIRKIEGLDIMVYKLITGKFEKSPFAGQDLDSPERGREMMIEEVKHA